MLSYIILYIIMMRKSTKCFVAWTVDTRRIGAGRVTSEPFRVVWKSKRKFWDSNITVFNGNLLPSEKQNMRLGLMDHVVNLGNANILCKGIRNPEDFGLTHPRLCWTPMALHSLSVIKWLFGTRRARSFGSITWLQGEKKCKLIFDSNGTHNNKIFETAKIYFVKLFLQNSLLPILVFVVVIFIWVVNLWLRRRHDVLLSISRYFHVFLILKCSVPSKISNALQANIGYPTKTLENSNLKKTVRIFFDFFNRNGIYFCYNSSFIYLQFEASGFWYSNILCFLTV